MKSKKECLESCEEINDCLDNNLEVHMYTSFFFVKAFGRLYDVWIKSPPSFRIEISISNIKIQ